MLPCSVHLRTYRHFGTWCWRSDWREFDSYGPPDQEGRHIGSDARQECMYLFDIKKTYDELMEDNGEFFLLET